MENFSWILLADIGENRGVNIWVEIVTYFKELVKETNPQIPYP